MIRRPPRSTQSRSSAASDVYKRQRVRGEPVRERQQLPRGRRDRPAVIEDLRAVRDPHAGGDLARVDIQTGTARIQDFHRTPPFIGTQAGSPQTRNLKSVLTGQAGATMRGTHGTCLLYTSDAADDLLCVDLGG